MKLLIEAYRKGAITADTLVVECLHMIDPEDPAQVLSGLPEEILPRMLDFARIYRPGEMVTNYPFPLCAEQVVAARHWIESNRRPVKSRPAPSHFSA